MNPRAGTREILAQQAAQGQIAFHLSANGLGDAVCGIYAACGAADAGFQVVYHSLHPNVLKRVSHPGVTITPRSGGIEESTLDLNRDYDKQLVESNDRKQWYCDTIAMFARCKKFLPKPPLNIDREIVKVRVKETPYVVLAPFSAWKSREWPATHWARLADLLVGAGYSVMAIDAKSEDRLKPTFGQTRARWTWGNDHEWMTDAILGASCVIGNDSGVPHIAGMLKVPTIAIHSHLPAELLWSHTGITSMAPKTNCVFCRWQRDRGYKTSCGAGCSALATVSPEDVLSMVQSISGARE